MHAHTHTHTRARARSSQRPLPTQLRTNTTDEHIHVLWGPRTRDRSSPAALAYLRVDRTATSTTSMIQLLNGIRTCSRKGQRLSLIVPHYFYINHLNRKGYCIFLQLQYSKLNFCCIFGFWISCASYKNTDYYRKYQRSNDYLNWGIFLRERVVLLSGAIDRKVDVAAMVHEWNMSMQHWRNNTDRERLHGGTN